MSPETKPAPIPDRDTAPFWEYCQAHELRAQRCTACGAFRWPPRAFCPKCWSWDFEWTKLSGRGTVASFSVVHHVTSPAFKDEAPYVVALVTLDGTGGQVTLLSNIVGCPWDHVQVGLPVEVTFEDRGPDLTVPVFVPDSPS